MAITKSKINEIAEEIKSCYIEAIFTSHFALVEAAHYIGKLLVDNFDDNLPEVLPSLAQKVGRSERTLYRAAQLYKKFPTLDKIPGGKAISMNRIINEHLIESGEKQESKEENCTHGVIICAKCHKRL